MDLLDALAACHEPVNLKRLAAETGLRSISVETLYEAKAHYAR